MDIKVLPSPHFLPRTQCPAQDKPEQIETFHLPEQSHGPIPLRNDRPAADVFAERLTASDPASTPLAYIP